MAFGSCRPLAGRAERGALCAADAADDGKDGQLTGNGHAGPTSMASSDGTCTWLLSVLSLADGQNSMLGVDSRIGIPITSATHVAV